MGKAKAFGLRFDKERLRRATKPKKLLIVGLGALVVNFIILAPFVLPWEGWNVVLSAIGGVMAAEWLDQND